ncbi:MAG: transcription antitermination factor NusB [Flavobacteriaceae bacterium]
MLTRRHIRIKVMQSVYSFSFKKNHNLEDEVNFFKDSVAQTFDLYLLLLGLFRSISHYVDEQIDLYHQHNMLADERYSKFKKLAHNPALRFFHNHPTLEKNIQRKKFIRWDLEFKFLKELLDSLFESDFFLEYLRINEPTEQNHIQCLVVLFKQKIAPSPYVYGHVEDKGLTWTDDLPLVNTFLLKMLKNIKTNDLQSLQFPMPIENREDMDFGVHLLEQVIAKEDELQKELNGKTPNWDEERIAHLDNIILKTAIAELLFFPNIPVKVTLNEYLEIAKDYSTPNSNHFVNGVLDKLVREFQEEKRLNKTGRGLL